MKQGKIKTILFFSITLPAILFIAVVILTAACTKKTEGVIPASTYTSPANNGDTTMAITGTKKYLALGDSYTIGTSVNEADRYPVQTAALLKAQGVIVNVDIIATNGWTTADLLNATKNNPVKSDYDAVTLLIGVNNQYQGRTLDEYKQEFTTLLQRSIAFAKNNPAHVIVLSIPDYSVTPFAASSNKIKIATEIDAFNAANKTIADNLKVHYLEVTED